MADEPTIGEVVRILADFRRSFDQLASKVLTVEVWKAEREHIEYRLREAEKEVAEVKAKAHADREKREAERDAAIKQASATRRQALFAVLTAFVLPLLVIGMAGLVNAMKG